MSSKRKRAHAHSDQRNQSTDAVLITGGSGFIGKSLVRHLSAQNETIVSMYHHRLPEPMANVYPVCSDMSSVELMAAPLRGVEVVVHLAWDGTLTGPMHRPADSRLADPQNLKTLRNLLQAMEKSGIRRIIFLSAIGASRHTKVPFLQDKYLAEFEILNSRIPEKIIVRSSVVYGDTLGRDRFLSSIVNVMRAPWMYPVPKSDSSIRPIHVDDLATILQKLVRREMVDSSSIIEVTGNESFLVRDLFRLVLQKSGKGGKFAIRGQLGQSLVALFEREKRQPGSRPKLMDFLALGSKASENLDAHSELADVLPAQFHNIEDTMGGSKSKAVS